MAVDQERGSGREAGLHGQGVAGIDLDQDKALPGRTVALGFGLDAVKEGLLELQDFLYAHANDEWLRGSCRGVGEDDIFKLVGAGGKDGGALVDLGGIEQVEDREVLHLENLVHAFEAESAFTIEKVGDMSLFESGLLGEAKAG